MHSQRLSDTQIQHNLLRATRNSVRAHIPVQALDTAALAAARVRQATKDLRGFAGAELEGGGGLSLEAGDGAAELEHGLHLVHALALEDEVLEPVVAGLDLAGHVGQLQPDDRVIDQLLAEGAALVRVLDAVLVTHAREAQALDDDADALVVEVGHDDLEALVLLADQVLDGHLDVLEGDVGGAAAPHTLAVHAAGADAAHIALDEQHRDTIHALLTGADGGGEVVAPDTVGDPLLLAVHDVVLAILGELGLAGKVCNITTSICGLSVLDSFRGA